MQQYNPVIIPLSYTESKDAPVGRGVSVTHVLPAGGDPGQDTRREDGELAANPRTVNVHFASSNYGPLWMPAVTSWLRAVAFASRYYTVHHGKIGAVGITDRMYTHAADNQLVDDFLEDETATHLFHTECDMLLPDDAITKLVALDKDIASGLYFIRNGEGQPCLYQKVVVNRDNPYPHSPVRIFPQDRPFRVDCPGLGCVVFKRSVFERLPRPWFDLSANRYGSDMFFFTNAKRAGIETWCDPSVRCGQVDYTVITYEAYEKRLKDDEWLSKGVILGGLD